MNEKTGLQANSVFRGVSGRACSGVIHGIGGGDTREHDGREREHGESLNTPETGRRGYTGAAKA